MPHPYYITVLRHRGGFARTLHSSEGVADLAGAHRIMKPLEAAGLQPRFHPSGDAGDIALVDQATDLQERNALRGQARLLASERDQLLAVAESCQSVFAQLLRSDANPVLTATLRYVTEAVGRVREQQLQAPQSLFASWQPDTIRYIADSLKQAADAVDRSASGHEAKALSARVTAALALLGAAAEGAQSMSVKQLLDLYAPAPIQGEDA